MEQLSRLTFPMNYYESYNLTNSILNPTTPSTLEMKSNGIIDYIGSHLERIRLLVIVYLLTIIWILYLILYHSRTQGITLFYTVAIKIIRPVAYHRLEYLTEKLLELSCKSHEKVQEKECNQKILSNPIQKLFSSSFKNNFCNHQSSNNDKQDIFLNVNNQQEYNKRSFRIPIVYISKKNFYPKIKIIPVNSCQQFLSNKHSLDKIKSMSTIRTLRSESQCSSPPIESTVPLVSTNERRRHSITTTNASEIKSNIEKLPLKDRQKKVTLEVKTNTYNRKVQVKTTQKDTICTKTKSSNSNETQLTSPQQTQFEQPPKKSLTSNSCIQSVRVSVSSPTNDNKYLDKPEPQSPTYSSMISNFIRENLNEQPQFDDKEETFNHRPLLDLINELNQRNSLKQTQYVPELDHHHHQTLSPSPSPSRILPPKQLPTFTPVIVHRKYQEPIGHFDLVDNSENSSLSNVSFNPRHSRSGVMRSYTFTTPDDIDTDSNKISSVSTTTFQSTPELTSSNQSVISNVLNTKHNSPLSTSASSLTSTLNVNTTGTSTTNIDDKNEAKRKAIAMQMYDTEKSYVEALKNLVTKYYLPMKDKDIVSNDLINDIFYKIPEIHIHHTAFLLSLSQKLNQWDNKQTVGDIVLQMFTRTSVIETYTSFVNNYKTAQIAIRLCRDFSSFNKFLEQQARDHHGKLTLRDLIIQPVQRIPRYELYIKDFLKCTNPNHPDYQLLLKAQSEIHSLAEKIDQVQKEVGSTDLTVTNNSLEVVQDMIENLTDLVNADRYYIRHDVVTLQSPLGLKKDRCIFLFNDLIIITICKRRSGTLTKKTTNSVIVNSPSGKQYIDNAKHKLIMKISLESVDLAADHLKKRKSSVSTPPSLLKSNSISSTTSEKHRNLEEDVIILGQMTNLAKTMTVPHQQLDDLLKETLNNINKQLIDETISTTNIRSTTPDPFILSDNIQQKSNNIQLIIHTTERTETIDVIFASSEDKIIWEKSFLEAKRILFETAAGKRKVIFQHVLTLPYTRPGSQFSCGVARSYSDDLFLCYTDGDIYLINIESNATLKSSNKIPLSGINCIGYIPSNKTRRSSVNITKQEDDHDHNHHHHHHHRGHDKRNSVFQEQLNTYSKARTIDSLLEIDSSDDDDVINNEENLSLNESSSNLSETNLNNEHSETRQATIWLGTRDGGLFICECSQTVKTFGRKSRICKQLNSSIHSILYTDNKVFLALNYGQLCIFTRDINDRWDFDCPIIKSIEENSKKSDNGNGEFNNDENSDRISILTLVAGRLWCAIRDKIYVVCPNSLNVEHSFIVDDCHRHVSSIAAGGSSMHHVWIASQGSHEIRLYHATHFVCLLETSIRTAVTQKLQTCDDIIRAHKLGCLYVSTLYVCKETLWIGTSSGVILNLTIPQLIDSLSTSTNNKLTSNSIQLKGLSYGHAGPVRFIISIDKNFISTTEEGTTIKTFVITIGDGFEDYNNNDETLGKDDALSHLILWKI
ncbi:unnamed protein product [Rotaria sp. Silwood1]|nr:unnamed protein product [Rotaria sp. Silwood1]